MASSPKSFKLGSPKYTSSRNKKGKAGLFSRQNSLNNSERRNSANLSYRQIIKIKQDALMKKKGRLMYNNQ